MSNSNNTPRGGGDDGNAEEMDLSCLADMGQIMMVFTGAQGGGGGRRRSSRQNKRTQSGGGPQTRSKKHRPPPIDNPCSDFYDDDEIEYYEGLKYEQQLAIASMEQKIIERNNQRVPLRFRIIESGVDEYVKSIAIKKLDVLYTIDHSSSEYHKIMTWIEALCRLPINKYAPLAIDKDSTVHEKQGFILNTRKHLDQAVYGHVNAKDHVMRLIAQWITKPDARGMVLALQGPMGVGKTQFALEGIAKALSLPFCFISLGGASDGSMLDGFAVTYEGSTYGRICEVLMKAQVCNPVMYFDELDKVSETARGEEIINLLIHLTDPTQNSKFTDKYFGDVHIDLSRCLMVFSYNDIERVNPILRDRMYTIQVQGYEVQDKVKIARRHLLPEIFKEYAFADGDISFSDDIIRHIISVIPHEQGVRGLKRALNVIVGDLNLQRVLRPETGHAAVITPELIAPVLATLRGNDNRHMNAMYI
jgi:ATP-dependent Lon protease